MWFTLARSNKYSPGAARVAPGVRTVWSGMGVPPLNVSIFRSLDHTLARHAAANWALGVKSCVPGAAQRDPGERSESRGNGALPGPRRAAQRRSQAPDQHRITRATRYVLQ